MVFASQRKSETHAANDRVYEKVTKLSKTRNVLTGSNQYFLAVRIVIFETLLF